MRKLAKVFNTLAIFSILLTNVVNPAIVLADTVFDNPQGPDSLLERSPMEDEIQTQESESESESESDDQVLAAEDAAKTEEAEFGEEAESSEVVSQEVVDQDDESKFDEEISSEDEKSQEAEPGEGFSSEESEQFEPELQNEVQTKDNSETSLSEETENQENGENEEELYWIEEGGKYTSSKPVFENEIYEIEGLDNLKIKFTGIDGEPGKLYAEEVEAPDSVDGKKVVSKAYNISSDMKNGTFVYDLYLPKTGDEGSEIKYSEDGKEFKDVEGEKEEDDYIKVEGLDHFTVFVVVTDSSDCPGGVIFGDECFDSIRDAVTAASTDSNAPHTINVSSGTYTEEVVIHNNSNLNGLDIIGEDGVQIDGRITIQNGGDASDPLTISNVDVIGGGTGSIAGIIFEGTTSYVELVDVSATNMENGIYVEDGNHSNLSLSDCEFSDNNQSGVNITGGTVTSMEVENTELSTNLRGFSVNGTATVSSVSFNSVTIEENDEHGIYLYAVASGDVSDIAINNSVIFSNGYGIHIDSGTTNVVITENDIQNNINEAINVTGSPATSSANHNNITGNGVGVNNSSGTTDTFDATLNWWGEHDGPGGAGTGGGDTISTEVDYIEFLCKEYPPEYASSGGVCPTGYIQGRTFMDTDVENGIQDNSGETNTDGFTVRLYDVNWDSVQDANGNHELTTPTTGQGQYRFVDLLATNEIYHVCAAGRTGYAYSPADIGQEAVDLGGTSYGYALTVENMSGMSDESPVCWQVSLNAADAGYVKFGFIQLDVPSTEGWNLRSVSGESNPEARPADLMPGDITNGDIDEYGDARASHLVNYSGMQSIRGYDIGIVRRVSVPNGGVGTYTGYSMNNPGEFYTDYVRFGTAQGIQGVWQIELASFMDLNGNGNYDDNEPISGWGDVSELELDSVSPGSVNFTSPIAPAYFTRLGDHEAHGNAMVNITFEESADPSDVEYYEYQYRRALLDNTGIGGGAVVISSPTCTDGECVWTAVVNDFIHNIHRIRVVDAAGNASDWSNWNDMSFSEFANIAPEDFEYEDYRNFLDGTPSGVFDSADGYVHGNGGFAIREQVIPTSSIINPVGPIITNNPNLTVEYTASDEHTEVKSVELRYDYTDGEGTSLENQLMTVDNATAGSISVDLSDSADGHGDGVYCFYTIAEDVVDNLDLDSGVGNREDDTTKVCELEVELDTVPPAETIFWVEEDTSEVLVAWTLVTDADRYYIYREGSGSPVATVDGSVDSWIDTTPGANYEVRAVDAAGNESNPQTAKEVELFDYVIDDNAMENDFHATGVGSAVSGDQWRSIGTQSGSNNPDYVSYPEFRQNFIGGDHYVYDGENTNTDGVFEWTTADGVQDGVYDVYVQFDCTSIRGDAQYDILADGNMLTDTPIVIDQGADGTYCTDNGMDHHVSYEGPGWIKLDGEYSFYEEPQITVRLTVAGREPWVIADGVALKRISELSPIVSIGNGNGQEPANTSPAHEEIVDTGFVPVFASVIDDNIEHYHYRVIPDGYSETDMKLNGADPYMNGYCPDQDYTDCYPYSEVVSLTDSIIDEKIGLYNAGGMDDGLNTSLLADGDYWLVIGARDQSGNRTAVDYLEDPRIKIIVSNSGPTIEMPTSETFYEGDVIPDEQITISDGNELASYSISVTDGGGNLAYLKDYTYPPESEVVSDVIAEASELGEYFYTNLYPEGSYIVTVTAYDKTGANTTMTGTYTLENVAPSISLFALESTVILEGETAQFDVSFEDPSLNVEDPNYPDKAPDDYMWTYEFDFDGDGVADDSYTDSDSTPAYELTFMTEEYYYEGIYDIAVRVCESDVVSADPTQTGEGECSDWSVKTLTVQNNAPTIVVDPSDETFEKNDYDKININAYVSGGNAPYTVGWITVFEDGETVEGTCYSNNDWDPNSMMFSGWVDGDEEKNDPDYDSDYECIAYVVDADGDRAEAIARIDMEYDGDDEDDDIENNQPYYPPVITPEEGEGAVEGEETGPEDVIDLGEDSGDGEVLGERTCEAKSRLSGHVYYDENTNDLYDDGENGVEAVTVTIYYFDEEGKEVIVDQVDTDASGKWEAQVCPGEYKVRIDTQDLPENVKLASEEVQGINVVADSDENTVDYEIEDQRGFLAKYWWLLMLGLFVLLGIIFVVSQQGKE